MFPSTAILSILHDSSPFKADKVIPSLAEDKGDSLSSGEGSDATEDTISFETLLLLFLRVHEGNLILAGFESLRCVFFSIQGNEKN